MVTRYHDVRTVLSNHHRFSRALAAGLNVSPLVTAGHVRLARVATADPPEHTRLRRVFNKGFSATQAQQQRPWVTRLVDAGIDRLMSVGSPADLARELFNPLALQLFGEMMGVPAQDREYVRTLSTVLQSTSLPPEEIRRHSDTAAAYFDELVLRRRQRPGGDIVSEALRMQDLRPDGVPDEDIAAMATGTFATGVEALTCQLQIGTHALLSHQQQLAMLRSRPELIPAAVEELMRYTPPVIGAARARYVRQETDVGGVLLRAGELVLPSHSAANFDPAVFPDPRRLDLLREHTPTLTFGFGAHYCQAAQFVRMVMTVVISALIERLHDLRLGVPNEGLRWKRGRRLRQFEELPVSWR